MKIYTDMRKEDFKKFEELCDLEGKSKYLKAKEMLQEQTQREYIKFLQTQDM